MAISEDPLYLEVSEQLDSFCMRYLERIAREQQRLKACKIYSAIQSKRAQELKLNTELTARLAELSTRLDNLEQFCSDFASGLKIADSDQQRLDNAKEMYEISKKLVNIRFDYSAPPEMVKGYIKCETRRTLTPFEFPADQVGDALWTLLQGTTTTTGNKENRPRN